MKTIALIMLTVSMAVSAGAQRQQYYYFDKNATAFKTVYNGDGEVIGEQEYLVLSGDAARVLGQNTITKPGKKTEITTCNYCNVDGRLMIAMGRNKDGEEVFLDYGSGMHTGSAVIESIVFCTQAKLAGVKWNITCTISDRKVTSGSETISSEMGKWECAKTEYDMELRSNFLGIPVNVHVIEWFAPGTGVVRTDVYRKGKLYEKRLLTGFRSIGTDAFADDI